MSTSFRSRQGNNAVNFDSISVAGVPVAAGKVASITVVAANAAANTIDVVLTALDANGSPIAQVIPMRVWLSDAANGAGGSTHTHSTGPAFTVGEEISEFITNDSWEILTNASGVATLRLLDTANEDQTINAAIGATLGQDTTVAGDWSA